MKKIVVLLFLLIFGLQTEAQWVEKNNGLYGGPITALAVNGNNLFAGTTDVNRLAGNGIFRSSNNGTNWTPVNSGLTNGFTDGFTNLSVSSFLVNGAIVYAVTNFGIFYSFDNGESWLEGSKGLNAIITSIAVIDNLLFAGTDHGVYLQTVAGWIPVNTGLMSLQIKSLVVSGNSLFAGTAEGGVFLSTNRGASWTDAGLTNQSITSLIVNGNNLFAGTFSGNVFLSKDNGASWTASSTGLAGGYIISFLASGTNLFAGTSNGLFVSANNGTSWTAANTGLRSQSAIYSLAVSGSNLFVGTQYGVFLSTNSGTSWAATNNGLTNLSVYSLEANATNLFAGTSQGVFVSGNTGASWTVTGLTNPWVISLAFSDSNLYAGTYGNGIFRSSDNGASWTAINSGLVNNPVNLSTIAIKSFASIGTNLFVGTSNGVYTSTNNGANWTAMNTGLSNQYVNSLATVGSNLFAGTSGGGVFLSINNGANWTAVNTGLTSLDAKTLTASGSKLFAGMSDGVYVSSNNGLSWAYYVGKPPDKSSLVASGNSIFVGTLSGDIFVVNDNSLPTSGHVGTGTGLNDLMVTDDMLYAARDGGVWSRPLTDVVTSILSFEPTSGVLGTTVTINGGGFDTRPLYNYVTFNGVVAPVTASTSTKMTITVPVGASSSPISVYANGQKVISSQVFSIIVKQDQSIAFSTLTNKIFSDAAFTLSATSNSNLPISYTSSNTSVATISGNSVTIVGAGLTTITASQAGNSEYNPAANVQQALTVNKAALTATAENKTKTFGDANPPFTITYTGFVGTDNPSVIDIAPSISSIATTTSNTGAYPITLTGGTDNNYMITNVNGTLTILTKDQTIIFSTLSDRTVGDAAFVPTATASSSLPVSFESLTQNKITLSGNLVSIAAPGLATIRAKQDGNANFNAAPSVDRSFCIRPAMPTITVSGANTDSPTLTSSAGTGNQWFFNGNPISGAINTTLVVTQEGVYSLRVTIEGCTSQLSNEQTVLITGDIASGDDQMTAYPNPSQDRVYVSLGGFAKTVEVQLKLTDLNGKVLYQKESRGKELVEISIAGFPSGSYLINAEQGSTNQQVKIVKK